jgi:DNA mismatch repair ATPase MutL
MCPHTESHPHTHICTQARTNKTGDPPKPIETRISQNQKNPKIRNLKTLSRRVKPEFHKNLPPNLQEEQSTKKKTFFDQNDFFAAAHPKTCTQSAENGDGTTKQTCTQFLASVIECGDMGERMHGKVTQG